MTARSKTRDSGASRERILEAAAELFSRHGYAGAGVDQLAARSGIAKTAIYYHFGNKEGLMAAVLERAASAWIEGIRQAAQQAGNPLERLDRALIGMRTMLEERPWIMKLVQVLALEVADEKPDVRATLLSLIHRARGAIIEGMHDALGMELPDAELVAGMLLAMVDGIAFGHQVVPDELSLDAAFAEVRRLTMFMVASRLNPQLAAWLEAGLPPSLPEPAAPQHK